MVSLCSIVLGVCDLTVDEKDDGSKLEEWKALMGMMGNEF